MFGVIYYKNRITIINNKALYSLRLNSYRHNLLFSLFIATFCRHRNINAIFLLKYMEKSCFFVLFV